MVTPGSVQVNEDGVATVVVKLEKEAPAPVEETKEVTVIFRDADGNIVKQEIITMPADAKIIDLSELELPEDYETEEVEVVIGEDGVAVVIIQKKQKPVDPVKYADAVLNIQFVTSSGVVVGNQSINKNGQVGETATFTQSELKLPNLYRLSGTFEDVVVAFGSTNDITVTVYKRSSGGSSGGGSGSSGSSRSSASSTPASRNELSGGSWKLDTVGWWYSYPNTVYAKGGWYKENVNNVQEWYYFNEAGYLISGWYTDTDGNKYYMHSVQDSNFGKMYTGWHQIDGVWNFFNDNPESGKLGAWVEGKEVPAELK